MTEFSRFDMLDGNVNSAQKDNRSSCSSTPEPFSYRNPMLAKLNGLSNSGSGSSSSTVTVMNGTGRGPTTRDRDINYCEVYYLSPSKRVYPVGQAKMTPANDRSWSTMAMQKQRERNRTQTPPVENGSFPDNFDMCSHYSDSAMQALRSGACGASNNNLVNSNGSSSGSIGPATRSHTNNVTFSTSQPEPANRGSLKRSKGRSNQSLCSCDVGDDAEINLNPNRPLYQYSLDRKTKTHTYTCEQNAQILLRLEREKNRKLGLDDDDDVDVDTNEDSAQQNTTNELDIIPPPPPPVSMNRKHQLKSLQDDIIKAYTTTNNNLELQSILDDCTTTILNCANAGHFASQSVKPDLCRVTQQIPKSNSSNATGITRDDFYVPSSKGPNSMYIYQPEESLGHILTASKYNTIGPSSHYAKQLATYHQQNNTTTCNLAHVDNNNLSANGRYFSQSLSNFPFDGQHHHAHHPQHQQHQQHHGYHWFHDNYHQAVQVPECRTEQDLLVQATGVHPYKQFKGLSSSCNFGETNLLHSSISTMDSMNGGLKAKLQSQLKTKKKQLQQEQQQFHTSTSSFMPWKHRQCPSRGSSSSASNSLRFDAAKHWLAVSSILLIIGAASVAVPLALRVAASAPFEERLQVATQLLDQVPLIDGHNDLPWNIRKFLHNKLNDFNFDEDLRNVMPWARSHWSHTDLQRLKKGRVAAQFWAAYVPCEAQHRDAVQLTLEQIDVIKRLTERYSPQLTTCTSASDIIEAHKSHQLCSLTGVEGGHSLGGSLAVLRTLYAIGVRYMTLTSTCHTPWADSSYADAPTFNVKHGGLTAFGKTIIREMNRLGMIVDLSHVSTGTMRDALNISEAPVIFSHSSAYELCNSSRNVQDDILHAVAKNGGLVMVNFYSKFLSCSDNSTVHDAVAHINHIKRVAGIDHVGLGAGFDGINFTPKGLEDVSTYPTLFAELLGVGWSMEDLTKLAGGNFLRVMTEVENIRDTKKLSGVRPFEDKPNFRKEDPYNCTSS